MKLLKYSIQLPFIHNCSCFLYFVRLSLSLFVAYHGSKDHFGKNFFHRLIFNAVHEIVQHDFGSICSFSGLVFWNEISPNDIWVCSLQEPLCSSQSMLLCENVHTLPARNRLVQILCRLFLRAASAVFPFGRTCGIKLT